MLLVLLETQETPEMQAKVPAEAEVEVDLAGLLLPITPPPIPRIRVKEAILLLQPQAILRLIVTAALVVLVLPLLPVVLEVEVDPVVVVPTVLGRLGQPEVLVPQETQETQVLALTQEDLVVLVLPQQIPMLQTLA